MSERSVGVSLEAAKRRMRATSEDRGRRWLAFGNMEHPRRNVVGVLG